MILTLAAMSMAALSAPDERAAFTAAGFKLNGKDWRSCAKPSGTDYTPGFTWVVADLNRDGRMEAVLAERGGGCFGPAGAGYWLVSKQADGSWRLISKGLGTVRVLEGTQGVGNWPDLEIGGAGQCFPIHRWNGRSYVVNRREFRGKPCR